MSTTAKLWVLLYEDTSQFGDSGFPVDILCRSMIILSWIPLPSRVSISRSSRTTRPCSFSGGREKRIYAIPPYTEVKPLVFEDRPFCKEDFGLYCCERCGSSGVFLDVVKGGIGTGTTAPIPTSVIERCPKKAGRSEHVTI